MILTEWSEDRIVCGTDTGTGIGVSSSCSRRIFKMVWFEAARSFGVLLFYRNTTDFKIVAKLSTEYILHMYYKYVYKYM